MVPDGGNEEGTMIEVAEKSMLWVKFVVTGKQCHASTPDKGKNSLVGAARLILGLAALKERFGDRDVLFSPPASTFETTKMEANVPNVNTIPGKDVFYLDGRVLPRYALGDVLEVCEEIAQGVSRETGLDIQVDPVHVQPAPAPTSAEAPVVKALARAVKTVTGKESKAMGIGGGDGRRLFPQGGVACRGLGHGFGNGPPTKRVLPYFKGDHRRQNPGQALPGRSAVTAIDEGLRFLF